MIPLNLKIMKLLLKSISVLLEKFPASDSMSIILFQMN